MADVSFVAGEMQVLAGSRTSLVNAGADVIEQFDWVYPNGSVWELASNATEAKSAAGGIAMTRCAAEGKFQVLRSGGFKTTTAEFDPDEVYVLSVDGAMAPDSDKASMDWLTDLGRAVSTTEFHLNIKSHGYQAA